MYKVKELSSCSPIFQFLKRSLLESRARHRKRLNSTQICAAPEIVVERIEEVLNPRLLEKYALELQHMTGLSRAGSSKNIAVDHAIALEPTYGVDLNEVLLYHG